MKKNNSEIIGVKVHNALTDLAISISDTLPNIIADLEITLEELVNIPGFQRHHKEPIRNIKAALRTCKKAWTKLDNTNAYIHHLVRNEPRCSCGTNLEAKS